MIDAGAVRHPDMAVTTSLVSSSAVVAGTKPRKAIITSAAMQASLRRIGSIRFARAGPYLLGDVNEEHHDVLSDKDRSDEASHGGAAIA